MHKHTHGPWHRGHYQDRLVDRYAGNAEWARIRGTDGQLIAKIASVHPNGERESTDFDIEVANAYLIAAAPDLLEALTWTLELLEKCDAAGIPIAGDLTGRACQSAARAALAKAEVPK